MTSTPEPAAVEDPPCWHGQLEAAVAYYRIVAAEDDPTAVGYRAELRIQCAACQEPFVWTGVPGGVSSAHPTSSLDGTTLVAPLRPASASPEFGMGLLSVSATVHTSE